MTITSIAHERITRRLREKYTAATPISKIDVDSIMYELPDDGSRENVSDFAYGLVGDPLTTERLNYAVTQFDSMVEYKTSTTGGLGDNPHPDLVEHNTMIGVPAQSGSTAADIAQAAEHDRQNVEATQAAQAIDRTQAVGGSETGGREINPSDATVAADTSQPDNG